MVELYDWRKCVLFCLFDFLHKQYNDLALQNSNYTLCLNMFLYGKSLSSSCSLHFAPIWCFGFLLFQQYLETGGNYLPEYLISFWTILICTCFSIFLEFTVFQICVQNFRFMQFSSNEHKSIYRCLNFVVLRFWSLKHNSNIAILKSIKNMNIEKKT